MQLLWSARFIRDIKRLAFPHPDSGELVISFLTLGSHDDVYSSRH